MVATLQRSLRSNTSRCCGNKAGLPENCLMLKYRFPGPLPEIPFRRSGVRPRSLHFSNSHLYRPHLSGALIYTRDDLDKKYQRTPLAESL